MVNRNWSTVPERQALEEASARFEAAIAQLADIDVQRLDYAGVVILVQHYSNIVALGRHVLQMQQLYLTPLGPPPMFTNRNIAIAELDERESVRHFRFRVRDLQRLADRLWPKFQAVSGEADPACIQVKSRYTVSYEMGLLVMLFRLAHRGRLCDMEQRFSMDSNRISSIASTFYSYFYAVGMPYLSDIGLFHTRFPDYAENNHRLTHGLVDDVFAYVDGTFWETCRPSENQEDLYSGYKRGHGLHYQGIVAPDGLLIHYFGPIAGARSDGYMFQQSKIEQRLEALMPLDENNPPYRLYGDAAYPTTPYIFAAYKDTVPGSSEAQCNKDMSSGRICVEWAFKEITKNFPLVSVRNANKTLQNPLTLIHFVAAFLANIHCTMNGNQQSARYQSHKLTFEEYIDLIP